MFTLKKKCNFILVLIKLVSDESDKIQRCCDQKCVLRAGENGRHLVRLRQPESSAFVTRITDIFLYLGHARAHDKRHRASPGDHVKKMSRIFLCLDQKGINFLGSAQLSLLKSDKR